MIFHKNFSSIVIFQLSRNALVTDVANFKKANGMLRYGSAVILVI